MAVLVVEVRTLAAASSMHQALLGHDNLVTTSYFALPAGDSHAGMRLISPWETFPLHM